MKINVDSLKAFPSFEKNKTTIINKPPPITTTTKKKKMKTKIIFDLRIKSVFLFAKKFFNLRVGGGFNSGFL